MKQIKKLGRSAKNGVVTCFAGFGCQNFKAKKQILKKPKILKYTKYILIGVATFTGLYWVRNLKISTKVKCWIVLSALLGMFEGIKISKGRKLKAKFKQLIAALFFAAKPPQINPKPAPPRLPDPPAQQAPAPAPKQTPKKGKGGIKQPPKTSAKPARRGEEGWIVLGPETVIYFEKQRKKWKTKKMIEAEIRQAQNEEFINAEYEDYQQL